MSQAKLIKDLNGLKNFAAVYSTNFTLIVFFRQKIEDDCLWNVSYWDCLKQQSAHNHKHNSHGLYSYLIVVNLTRDYNIREKTYQKLRQWLPTPEQLVATQNDDQDEESDAGIAAWCSGKTDKVRGITID